MTVTGREQQSYVPVKVDGLFGWVSADWIERGSVSLEQTAASPDATSQPGTATAISDVEMRSAPGDDAAMMTTIPSVSVVTLTGEAQDGFLGVVFNGQEGWANASFLAVAEVAPGTTTLLQPADAAAQTQPVDAAVASAPAQPFQTSPGTQTVTTTNVNLRSQPSAESMVLSVLPEGTAVTMTGSQANGYVNVRIDGQAGWIDSAYLQ
jgi:zinc D-Ala-D-Ala carboxypeptidase